MLSKSLDCPLNNRGDERNEVKRRGYSRANNHTTSASVALWGLLRETKVSDVATDANAPRRRKNANKFAYSLALHYLCGLNRL